MSTAKYDHWHAPPMSKMWCDVRAAADVRCICTMFEKVRPCEKTKIWRESEQEQKQEQEQEESKNKVRVNNGT
jgi:hypothetical protein